MVQQLADLGMPASLLLVRVLHAIIALNQAPNNPGHGQEGTIDW